MKLTATTFGSLVLLSACSTAIIAQDVATPAKATATATATVQTKVKEKTRTKPKADKEKNFTSIFDGKTLNGWEQKNGTARYEVVDGTIMGHTEVGSPNSFLCSSKEYADFELRFEVKVDPGLNSGVQIRSVSKDDINNGRVHGPQVEIESDPGESGYIYSEGTGRGWISPTQTQRNVFKNDGWNRYRVLADGNRIQTWINGKRIEDLDVPAVESTKGFLGLQVHGIGKDLGPFKVQWRNIRIQELKGTESRRAVAIHGTPTIDGKIDDVWKKVPRLVTSRPVTEHNALEEGDVPATASVKCMWDDGHLYCLAVVKDSKISTENDDSWEKDSVEFFVDGNLARATSYDSDDGQYRTDASGVNTVGDSNDIADYTSAVTKTKDGYIVEACIKIDTDAGKIGFDVQVNNDAGEGRRQSTMKWNEPTNKSFEDASGVGTLTLRKPAVKK